MNDKEIDVLAINETRMDDSVQGCRNHGCSGCKCTRCLLHFQLCGAVRVQCGCSRAKITAKFGQNLKDFLKILSKKNVYIINCENTEKFFCHVGKNIVECL